MKADQNSRKPNMDSDSSFGIYILTYPKDYHLSVALIRSIRYFNSNLPITILPGDGFSLDTYPLHDVDVLEKPKSFSYEAKYGYDRKFWVFDGVYEKFLYIDADIINCRNIGQLIDRIKNTQEPFIFANLPDRNEYLENMEKLRLVGHEEEKKYHTYRIGNIDNIELFDPKFDWRTNYGFNGGLWASSRKSFDINWFNKLRDRETEFFSLQLNKEFEDNNLGDLFYGDQGKLAYLAYSKGVNVLNLHPDGHYIWGGLPFHQSLNEIIQGQSSVPFIHWAGVPRPSASLFSRYPLFYFYSKIMYVVYTFSEQHEVPGYYIWRHFSDITGKEIFIKTIKDFKWVFGVWLKNIFKASKHYYPSLKLEHSKPQNSGKINDK